MLAKRNPLVKLTEGKLRINLGQGNQRIPPHKLLHRNAALRQAAAVQEHTGFIRLDENKHLERAESEISIPFFS